MTAPNEMPRLLVSTAGSVGRIVFSNSRKRNALTFEMWRDLPAAIASLDADDTIRVLVLEGGGSDFTAGADISEFTNDPVKLAEFDRAVEAAYDAAPACSKPVIAKIRGVCFGGGLGLAAGCDLRFCASDSTFRMPAARLGVGYRLDGIRRFVELIGPANTADLFFSARRFNTTEAVHMGFVSAALPSDALDDHVTAYARTVAENAPLTVRAAKGAIRAAAHDATPQDLAAVQDLIDACYTSEDYLEGQRAFLGKREPRFQGR
jgi:enoyl-CoA hydratase/carnithine racemase